MNERLELQKLRIAETEYETTFTKKFLNRKRYIAPDPNSILCVIPGVVQRIHVRPGQEVRKGEPLCVLEAMKMQNDVVSPFDARVGSVSIEVGQMVTSGTILMELVPAKSE
jgi:biotin carboxyl carrier protein